MIPDVTPNGVFYLPPTGWLTSFYNPPSFNNKAEQVITVKQGDKVIGYYLPPFSAKKLDQKIEDDETKHRQDLLLIKELRKQIKVLDARNKLQVDLNEDNNTSL